MTRIIVCLVGAIGTWGMAQVVLAAPLMGQIAPDTQALGPIGGYAVPGSIGALILLMGYSLKEVYRMLADERVMGADRVTNEAKEFAVQLQRTYESNKADLARLYAEMRDLAQQNMARQDAAYERLLSLVVNQVKGGEKSQ